MALLLSPGCGRGHRHHGARRHGVPAAAPAPPCDGHRGCRDGPAHSRRPSASPRLANIGQDRRSVPERADDGWQRAFGKAFGRHWPARALRTWWTLRAGLGTGTGMQPARKNPNFAQQRRHHPQQQAQRNRGQRRSGCAGARTARSAGEAADDARLSAANAVLILRLAQAADKSFILGSGRPRHWIAAPAIARATCSGQFDCCSTPFRLASSEFRCARATVTSLAIGAGDAADFLGDLGVEIALSAPCTAISLGCSGPYLLESSPSWLIRSACWVRSCTIRGEATTWLTSAALPGCIRRLQRDRCRLVFRPARSGRARSGH